jgi:AcrR family transcriptional regulator
MATSSRRPELATTKRQAIEAAVLAATESLLAEGASFADLKIEQIATRAGISRTAFYFYFADRRELLMQLTEGVSDLLYAEGEEWWSGEGSGAEELRTALRTIAALYREHGPLLRAIVEVSTYDEEVGAFWRAVVGRFVDATRERIAAEQADGRVAADIAPEATAFALVWMSERTFHQMVVQQQAPADDDLVEALVRIWISSVYGSAAAT